MNASRRAANTVWVLGLLWSCTASAQPANYVVRFQTVGSSFSPAVYCDAGTPQTFLWTWFDGTTSTNYPIVTNNFGSAGARFQYLTVSPAQDLTKINLGFDGSDGGWTTQYVARPSQNVRAVYFPTPLTNLQYWTSAYNPITNKMDFSGFTALQNVECWHCTNLQHVGVAHLPSLRRASGTMPRWCSSAPGIETRPTEFAAPGGTMLLFVTLKREKK